jgi:hypothetical protein
MIARSLFLECQGDNVAETGSESLPAENHVEEYYSRYLKMVPFSKFPSCRVPYESVNGQLETVESRRASRDH